jgi:beta-N-acetylhexosaminidase
VVQANGVARNSVALPEPSAGLLHRILASNGQKTIVLAMGNPYLARDFPEVQNYLCTFSAAPVSEVSAVKALFGEIDIRGRLPVTIPGIAARGAGSAEMSRKIARE